MDRPDGARGPHSFEVAATQSERANLVNRGIQSLNFFDLRTVTAQVTELVALLFTDGISDNTESA